METGKWTLTIKTDKTEYSTFDLKSKEELIKTIGEASTVVDEMKFCGLILLNGEFIKRKYKKAEYKSKILTHIYAEQTLKLLEDQNALTYSDIFLFRNEIKDKPIELVCYYGFGDTAFLVEDLQQIL